MKRFALVFVIALVGWGAAAQAETWKADLILIAERSVSSCPKTGSADPYVLEVVDNKFSASNVTKYFTIPMPADGKIDVKYKSPTGLNLEMVGNIKTKQLELFNERYSCRYKLVFR